MSEGGVDWQSWLNQRTTQHLWWLLSGTATTRFIPWTRSATDAAAWDVVWNVFQMIDRTSPEWCLCSCEPHLTAFLSWTGAPLHVSLIWNHALFCYVLIPDRDRHPWRFQWQSAVAYPMYRTTGSALVCCVQGGRDAPRAFQQNWWLRSPVLTLKGPQDAA